MSSVTETPVSTFFITSHTIKSSIDTPNKLIKVASEPLSVPFTQSYDQSIEAGIVSSVLNLSEVTLVYKNVYVPDPGNYRSISTLSRFSKVDERLSVSLGLGRENSTEKAILQIPDTLGKPWKKIELVTCCLLLDLSKEFDR